MLIIEHTPIKLDDDGIDVVRAYVYANYPQARYYSLYIDYPTREDLNAKFSHEDIESLWWEQYPQWNHIIY